MLPSAFKIVRIEHPLKKGSKITNLIVTYWGRVEYIGVFICIEWFFVLICHSEITKVLSSQIEQIETWKIF